MLSFLLLRGALYALRRIACLLASSYVNAQQVVHLNALPLAAHHTTRAENDFRRRENNKPEANHGDVVRAEMVVQSLVDQGVKQVFGYPGGAVLDIYDALHTLGGIDHVLVRHEQAAVHMADGLARATGEVGVVLVTSGPGATNAITGIATAYMDSIPLVILSGQVATSLIGYDAFQSAIWSVSRARWLNTASS